MSLDVDMQNYLAVYQNHLAQNLKGESFAHMLLGLMSSRARLGPVLT